MRVVNTKTSNTVLGSNKQLAEGSDEVSHAMETGHVQVRQGWAAAVGHMVTEVHPCVSQSGTLAVLCCVGSFKTSLFLLSTRGVKSYPIFVVLIN